jgi:phosphoesterase RecJ-like protein
VIVIKRDIYKQIVKIIKSYKNIVIARHISPDPDAIASQIALRDSIRLTFPNKNVYAIGAGVSRFKYLGDLDHVDVSSIEHALLIVLDVPNFARVDGIDELQYDAILKIDHHPAMDIIGDVDWTDDTKSSTCEMLINLLLNSKLVLDQRIAEDLYVGLVFDNDRFLLSNTTKETFETVTALLNAIPINFVSLYDSLYNKKFSELKFYAYLINHLEITDNGFGYLIIDEETLEKYKMDSASPSHFINEFYFVEELLCWSFITYDDRSKLYKVNIRSRGPIINTVAEKYNGGGHKYASGCRLTNKSDIDKLLKELDEACLDYSAKEDN